MEIKRLAEGNVGIKIESNGNKWEKRGIKRFLVRRQRNYNYEVNWSVRNRHG